MCVYIYIYIYIYTEKERQREREREREEEQGMRFERAGYIHGDSARCAATVSGR